MSEILIFAGVVLVLGVYFLLTKNKKIEDANGPIVQEGPSAVEEQPQPQPAPAVEEQPAPVVQPEAASLETVKELPAEKPAKKKRTYKKKPAAKK
jgi:hypothetical protein